MRRTRTRRAAKYPAQYPRGVLRTNTAGSEADGGGGCISTQPPRLLSVNRSIPHGLHYTRSIIVLWGLSRYLHQIESKFSSTTYHNTNNPHPTLCYIVARGAVYCKAIQYRNTLSPTYTTANYHIPPPLYLHYGWGLFFTPIIHPYKISYC